jgi:hypothetical protein
MDLRPSSAFSRLSSERAFASAMDACRAKMRATASSVSSSECGATENRLSDPMTLSFVTRGTLTIER